MADLLGRPVGFDKLLVGITTMITFIQRRCHVVRIFRRNTRDLTRSDEKMATSSTFVGQPTGPPRMTPPTIEIFRKAVRYVLTEWPSLNFAIENGMGGSDSKQKQSWMCDHIAEVMILGKDVDLEDYLAEIINQEFDTIVEDGSLEYNVKWIEKFLKDCQQGKEQEVMDSINRAAVKKQSLGNMRIPPPMNATQESSDDDEDDDDDDDDA